MNKRIFLMPIRLGLCFFICSAIWKCSTFQNTRQTVQPAFYYWQSQLRLSEFERSYLDNLGAKRLYVKFFDVDWDEYTTQPVPLAVVEIDTARLGGLDIIPTIFITNRILLNISMNQLDTLAALIFQKIESLKTQHPLEIQFDCDWTAQTEAKYFALLDRFNSMLTSPSAKNQRPTILSATIRLHQLKYFEKTGVPPVDRGMLMCYNMGNLEDWSTQNSILDLEEAKKYLPANLTEYPLALDFALPLFRWGVLFRDGRMVKLLNNLDATELQDAGRFTMTDINRFEVIKSTYLQSHYLYVGDQLRLESVSPEALLDLANLVASCQNSTTNVAFYHLDSTITHLFTKTKMIEVLQRF